MHEMTEEERSQAAIDWIEGMVGCYSAVWHEWPWEDIKRLYLHLCFADHGEITLQDAKRIGFTL